MDEQTRKIEPQPIQTQQANTLPNPLGQANTQVDRLKNKDVGIPVNKTPNTAMPLQTAGITPNVQQIGFADTGGKIAGSGAPQPTVPDYTNEINAMYEAQRQQQTQALENAYNQNVQTLQNSRAEIAPTYNAQANDLATQYERTRRNNNIQADINGLNTGTASQMALAQQGNYLNSYGQVRSAQANAERAVDQKIADLEVGYKNSVAQALADNDYQKAAALLSEYKRRDEAAKEEQRYQYQIQTAEQKYQDQITRQREQDEFARQQYADQIARQQEQDAFTRERYEYEKTQAENQQALNEAKQRAAYGDFSGYAGLYGQDVANSMQQFWAMNNPDYAYSMGLITADQYEQMTGYSPDRSSLYSGYSSGGGGGSSYRGDSSSNNNSANGPGVYNPSAPAAGETGNGDLDRMVRRANYSSDEKFYLGEMNRINLEAMAEARDIAKQNGLKEGSDEWLRFVDMYAKEARETDPDYIANQNLYNSAKNTREADESAKRQAQNEQEKRNEPAETKMAQTAVQIEQNRQRLIEDNKKQTGENRTTSTSGTQAPKRTLAQILGLDE